MGLSVAVKGWGSWCSHMPLLSLPHRLIVLAQVKAFFFWGNLSQAPWLEVAPFLSCNSIPASWRIESRVSEIFIHPCSWQHYSQQPRGVLGMVGRKTDMSGWGRGRRGSSKKPPKLPRQGSHVKITKALQGNSFLAYQDQAKPVSTRSQHGHNWTKLRTAQTTPHLGKDMWTERDAT